MSIPSEGYNYSQCSFKDEDKLKIDEIFLIFKSKLDLIGLGNYYIDGKTDLLNKVSFKNLYEMSTTWEKLAFQLENINYKILVVKEYRMIIKLIEKAREKVNNMTELIQILEDKLKHDYSQIVTNDVLFSEYFSFKDFKNSFSIMTSPEIITLDELNEIKKQNLFKLIRRKIIADKANIHSLLSDQPKVIHINTIKQEDEKTFNLLRTEFFTTLCDEVFQIKVPYGKKTKTEIIRPSHQIAKSLKLERTEILYLTVSLDPIPAIELEPDHVIEFNNGMKFNVSKNQQVLSREMFYQIELDKLSTCNLVVPFYFSFIRCCLVKEQRTQNLNINDKSLDEDIYLKK